MAKFKDYFNSTTIRGRANVAKLTYASFAALYLFTRFKRSKKKTTKAEDTNNNFMEPQESLQVENFRSPSREYSKDKQKNGFSYEDNNKGQAMQAATPPVESNDSSGRRQNSKVDDTTANAESIAKTSKTKFESGGLDSNTTKPKTASYEQQSGDKECVLFL